MGKTDCERTRYAAICKKKTPDTARPMPNPARQDTEYAHGVTV
jgi:hypothetical protein